MEQDYVIKLCNDLCDVINANPMPISVKYFVIKDLFNEMQTIYNNYCRDIAVAVAQEEKTETKKVTVPIEYTEEELESLRKK